MIDGSDHMEVVRLRGGSEQGEGLSIISILNNRLSESQGETISAETQPSGPGEIKRSEQRKR